VYEQERRPVTAFEPADPGAAVLQTALVEPNGKNWRARHPNRLFWVHYELDGDKAGRLMSPVLHPEELET